MKKKAKKRNWLYYFYKENVMYVWVVVGVIVVSGFSIGMSIGKLSDNNNVLIDNNTNQNNIQDNNIVFNDNLSNNEVITTDNNNNNNDNKEIDNPVDRNDNNTNVYPSIETTSTDIEKQISKPEKKLEFIMPIQGEIMRDFTTDTLVYSNTLQEWIAHEGIDILADLSSPIKAVEAGEVIEIKNDPRYGSIIIIDHGQGFNSIYCNLSTLDMVHVGKKIEKGQVVSGVGNTALFEIKDNPHLHFELTKDGKTVNPLEHIK